MVNDQVDAVRTLFDKHLCATASFFEFLDFFEEKVDCALADDSEILQAVDSKRGQLPPSNPLFFELLRHRIRDAFDLVRFSHAITSS